MTVDPLKQQQYNEASAALHKLRLGLSVVSVTDQNGEKVTFQAADEARLQQYVNDLACAIGISSPHQYRPMKFIF
jgi:hypothetical protein